MTEEIKEPKEEKKAPKAKKVEAIFAGTGMVYWPEKGETIRFGKRPGSVMYVADKAKAKFLRSRDVEEVTEKDAKLMIETKGYIKL